MVKGRWAEFNKKLLSGEEVKELKRKFNDSTEYCKKVGYTSDEHMKKVNNNSEKVASIRGGIINTMVDFEHFLCLFISRYFSHDMKITELYEHILAQDFFTTFQKIKLFERIGYHKQEKYKGKYIGLSGIMIKLNELRNLVAHGTHFHFTKPELGFPYSGKSTHFDDKLAERFRSAFDQAYYSLYLLNEDLNEERFEEKYGRKRNLPKLTKKEIKELEKYNKNGK